MPGFYELILSAVCVMCVRVCAHVCVSAPKLLITSCIIWTQYDWLNKFYSFYMAAAVVISSGCDLRIEAHCGNQPNKSKPVLYKLL